MKIQSYLTTVCLLLAAVSCNEDDPKNEDVILINRTGGPILLNVQSSADGTSLPVYITTASTSETPPAVIVLHGSGGPWDDDDTDGDGIADACNAGDPSAQTAAWRDLLNLNGYVAVFVDSYSPRGTCENEGAYKNPPLKFYISGTFVRNRDAYDVLATLRKLRWSDNNARVIDAENVGVVGFSDGGTTVISTLYDPTATPSGWTWKQSFSGTTYTSEVMPPPALPTEGGFKVGVLYYPGSYHNGYYGNICNGSGIYRSYVDMLFHIAQNDDLADNTRCLVETMEENGGGAPTVYEYNSEHGFDGTSDPASATARTRTITFLNAKLK